MATGTMLETLRRIQDRYVLRRSARSVAGSVSPSSDACRCRTPSIAFFHWEGREIVVLPLRRVDRRSFQAFGNGKKSHTSFSVE